MRHRTIAGLAGLALLAAGCSAPEEERTSLPDEKIPAKNRHPETVILFPKAMIAEIRDDQIGVVQDAPYRFLLNAVARIDDTELSRHAWFPMGVEHAVDHPHRFRGVLSKVRGLLVSIQPIQAPPNAAGLPYLYEGVVETDHWQYVIFHAFHKDGDYVPGRDHVEAEGIFLRLHPLPTPRGDTKPAPFILGKWVRRI